VSEETKHKLKKALPWIIGGVVIVFFVLKMRSGGASKQTGSAPAQDLSMLGGGGSAPVMQQPAVVPGDVAQQFAQQFASSRERRQAMAAQWQDLGNQNGMGQQRYTGVVSKAWKQLVGGNWEDTFHAGHIITEQQAQQLSSQNHGPYAQGQGGFFSQVVNFIKGAGQIVTSVEGFPKIGGGGTPQYQGVIPDTIYSGAGVSRGQSPAANGRQRQNSNPSVGV